MKVWVVTLDDRESGYYVLGVFASEDSALAWCEGPGGEATVEQAGGWDDPDSPFETEADSTHHAGLGQNGSQIVVQPWEVHP